VSDVLLIGQVRIDPPVVLAPMAGVTSPPFRLLCRELGAGLVCGEMVSATALHYASQRSRDMLEVREAERPISLQVAAGNPEVAVTGVREAVAAGADLVDLNLGCPVPKVRKSGAGAVLLRDLGRAREVLQAAVETAGGTPVTVKIRAGWDEGSLCYVEAGRLAAEVGCAAVAFHARTAEQMYHGHADWERIRHLVSECPLPVIGNGDIHTAEDALRMVEQTGCAGVMVGREARRYPWVFREIRAALRGEPVPGPPPWPERLALGLRLCEGLAEHHGPKLGALNARSALGALAHGMPQSHRFRERAHRLASLEEIATLLREYAEQLQSGR
jgi:tRNA-dihydrouridine synthase B